MPSPTIENYDPAARAEFVRSHLPSGGLFAGHEWRIAPEPFALDSKVARELESLGRVLLQFYRAINLLYRQSAEGKQPEWIAELLDQGKPPELIALQRDQAFKNDVPRVIRPDVLLTESGLSITELDGVPGGIGLTSWLNRTYAKLGRTTASEPTPVRGHPDRARDDPKPNVIGGANGMRDGFAGIFDDAPRVHIVVSEEAETYRPEMEWMAEQMGGARFQVRSSKFLEFEEGDAVYRFFELFDLPNVPNAGRIVTLAREGKIRLTPPPKPIFEEKLLFALLWNRNLEGFWLRELGEAFFKRLLRLVPYSWVIDPAPLPPHAAYPELHLTDWRQLKSLSKKDRELILKISGFSQQAWGSRGVYLGSDLSAEDWSAAVDEAIRGFGRAPFVLQRFHKTAVVEAAHYNFATGRLEPMAGRVRLCPFYFVHGEAEKARPHLGGILATICPADKKLIHGMRDAILAPCALAMPKAAASE
jgi:hypothetical protein